jgi:hypothetical protein
MQAVALADGLAACEGLGGDEGLSVLGALLGALLAAVLGATGAIDD